MVAYTKFNWQVGIGGGTPVNGTNLNMVEQGIYDAHQELLQLMPIGTVAFYAAQTPPAGWFECDGSSKSTTTYAGLFNAIGYTYGGSGSSFNLPDLRGRFVRGLDEGAGKDPDTRALGSIQADDNKSHQHTLTETIVDSGLNSGSPEGSWWSTGRQTRYTSAFGGEFRPRNVALLPMVRWG